MSILISIGQIIVTLFFIYAFILGVMACVKLAKFDVRGTKNEAEENVEDANFEITIDYTIEDYFNEADRKSVV